MDLSKLSPAALKAAMQGGTAGWGSCGGADHHVRYMESVPPRSRRHCHCGCAKRATHSGMANGVCLTMGCEFAISRWVKTGAFPSLSKSAALPSPE